MNFLDLVKARYSVRSYSPQEVEKEKLDYILECVRLAPSAVNLQPWRFRVITDKPTLEALCKCYKREWLATAPCIIVACANHEESWHRRADNKDHADIDVAIVNRQVRRNSGQHLLLLHQSRIPGQFHPLLL